MDYLTLFLYVFFITVTPGPNNLMALYVCAENGFWEGRKYLMGATIGFSSIFILCGILNYWLSAFLSSATPYLKWIGVLYLLYLAFSILKSKSTKEENSFSTNSFIYGLTIQFVNAKVWLFGLTVYGMYVIPFTDYLPAMILFGISFSIIGFVSMIIWALGGASLKTLFAKYRKTFNVIMAALLVYCAYTVVF